jgi:hypothetical protein
MNATSHAILHTILSTDDSLSAAERNATQRLIDGRVEAPAGGAGGADEFLLVTQKRAAELLSVSRATIWRMTRDCLLHPVEIIPGTWRYPFREIIGFTPKGRAITPGSEAHRGKSAA